MKLFTIVAALVPLACAACRAVVPDPLPPSYPPVHDILRGAALGLAVMQTRSDVLFPEISLEYVIFPTRALRWTPDMPNVPAATNMASEDSPEMGDSVPKGSNPALSPTVNTRTVSSVWSRYCDRSSTLSQEDWDLIATTHIPATLFKCCKTRCKNGDLPQVRTIADR